MQPSEPQDVYSPVIVTVGTQTFTIESGPPSVKRTQGGYVLIETNANGASCPAQYHWVNTIPGKLRMTAAFSTCSDLVTVTPTSQGARVAVPGEDGKTVTYDYDGSTVTERGSA